MIIELLVKRRQLRAHEYWSRERLESYQNEAVRALRQYAYARSPFYQRFHKGLFGAPLLELPVLSKETLMDHFDELVTDRAIRLQDVKDYTSKQQRGELFLGPYRVQSTSGTSGRPGLFAYDKSEWWGMLSTALRAFETAGIEIRLTRRTRMAQITPTNPSHMSAQGAASTRSWWTPILLLSASEPLQTMVERLNGWQPEALLAYASIIRILANEQIEGRLLISPRTVISGSEVLTAETRRLAESAWGKVLFDMYGTTDCGGIGAECDRHRGMHLREDLAIIEVVDRDNRAVATGEYGEKLLVTVLNSRTQPLIRYELDDSLRLLAESCPCGRPFRLIGDIQGRVHDSLIFPSEVGENVKVHPIIFHEIVDTLPIRGWQLVQESDGLRLLLAGVQGSLDDTEVVDRIREALQRQGAIIPRIQIQHVDAIPQAASGKRRW